MDGQDQDPDPPQPVLAIGWRPNPPLIEANKNEAKIEARSEARSKPKVEAKKVRELLPEGPKILLRQTSHEQKANDMKSETKIGQESNVDFYNDESMFSLLESVALTRYAEYLREEGSPGLRTLFQTTESEYKDILPKMKPGHRLKFRRAVLQAKGERYSALLNVTGRTPGNFDHLEIPKQQIRNVHKIFEAYIYFFQHIFLRNGWRKIPYNRRDVEEMLKVAAEIVAKIRCYLDESREKGALILRQLSGNAHEYMWKVKDNPSADAVKTERFIRNVVHETLKDSRGYVEGLNEDLVEKLINDYIYHGWC